MFECGPGGLGFLDLIGKLSERIGYERRLDKCSCQSATKSSRALGSEKIQPTTFSSSSKVILGSI
jgi:hypothetical protein